MMPLPSRPLLCLTLLPLLAAAGLAWAGLVPLLPASGFLPAAGIEAQPLIQSILFFLKRNSMPLVFWPMTSSL